jgi:hypothetical protein
MQTSLGSSKCIREIEEVEKIMNLTLSLIHPKLFETGLGMLRRLRERESTKDIASKWQSVCSGIAIVCNRLTPAHRDSKGRPEWYDTLLNYSGTGGKPLLSINDIGLNLEYSSGTVVGFCGSVFEHEVKSWGDGDRVCYAHYMRENVRERLNVPAAGWVTTEMYN